MIPGIYTLTEAEYHSDPCDEPSLSASTAKVLLAQSPAHARECNAKLRTRPQEETEAKYDIGNAVHGLLLEGNGSVCVVPYEDWRSKPAKEMRELARADGLTPLLAKQWDEVQAMAESVRAQMDAHEAAPGLLVDGKPEQVLVWQEAGVWCRARVDWLHDDYSAIDDVKSTARSANPPDWSRKTMYALGGEIQAAFYIRGVEALTGVRPDFRFIVAETSAPYALGVVELEAAALALADEKIDFALDLWRGCLEENVWPGYSTEVYRAELPSWELTRWLERSAA